jgi:2-aminoethylphosphonate-pyruvate transaminase
MQGSGTFAIEAALGSFAPGRGRKTLVLVNGNYGERAVQILEHIKRPYARIDAGDSAPIVPQDVAAALDADPTSSSSSWSIARRRQASSIRWSTLPRR